MSCPEILQSRYAYLEPIYTLARNGAYKFAKYVISNTEVAPEAEQWYELVNRFSMPEETYGPVIFSVSFIKMAIKETPGLMVEGTARLTDLFTGRNNRVRRDYLLHGDRILRQDKCCLFNDSWNRFMRSLLPGENVKNMRREPPGWHFPCIAGSNLVILGDSLLHPLTSRMNTTPGTTVVSISGCDLLEAQYFLRYKTSVLSSRLHHYEGCDRSNPHITNVPLFPKICLECGGDCRSFFRGIILLQFGYNNSLKCNASQFRTQNISALFTEFDTLMAQTFPLAVFEYRQHCLCDTELVAYIRGMSPINVEERFRVQNEVQREISIRPHSRNTGFTWGIADMVRPDETVHPRHQIALARLLQVYDL